ncbi:hypothetical protein [Pseudomonas sp. Marseille-Q5115]|uniref:hypothetical protein n=1 Tax=Pseudomonas sp. Marseille-Q5115 TaxID=2866593 RepID=UPI001CE4030C|nr:hypothetical protein [Pseudomonas sp. Marseille-Q5115]
MSNSSTDKDGRPRDLQDNLVDTSKRAAIGGAAGAGVGYGTGSLLKRVVVWGKKGDKDWGKGWKANIALSVAGAIIGATSAAATKIEDLRILDGAGREQAKAKRDHDRLLGKK